jgi:dTDP-4-amino-4,6-dideoxygalactose transaminase
MTHHFEHSLAQRLAPIATALVLAIIWLKVGRVPTLGALATQSFQETKNLTCGEGVALLINDARYLERAENIREKGTNRARFFRGQVDKYSWCDVGSSYVMSDSLAVFHYLPLHLSEYAKRWGGKPGDCPVTEDVSDRLVRLPFFNSMTPDVQTRVLEAILSFQA